MNSISFVAHNTHRIKLTLINSRQNVFPSLLSAVPGIAAALVQSQDLPPDSSCASPDEKIQHSHEASNLENVLQLQEAGAIVDSALA